MRYFRPAVVVAIATLALVVPAAAGAQVSSFSVTVGHLQAQGTEVPVDVTFQCESGLYFAFVDASLTQVSGHKLAQGSGGFFSTGNPGTPCSSGPFSAAMTTTASGAFAFKEGIATVSVDVVLYDPTTDRFVDNNFTQAARLTKN